MIGQAKRIVELKKSLGNFEKEPVSNSNTPIISFTSGKGGTGKSFLCLNVAYKLSQLGKRVLVVDFDLNFSNLHIMLNVIPLKTLFQFFTSESLLEELIYEYTKTLHFIFGFSGFESKNVTENSISSFCNRLTFISANYDYVLVDTSSGGNDETLKVLSFTDFNVIIANPEPTATLDAYAIIKLTSASKNKNIKVVINKYFKKEDAEKSFENLQMAVNHFLNKNISLLGTIPFDREITDSVMNQELYLKNHSSNEAANQINLIIKEILNIKQLANNNHI
jgi:flagellar biosynthesis protein FlhG